MKARDAINSRAVLNLTSPIPDPKATRVSSRDFKPTDEHRVVVAGQAAIGTEHWIIARALGIGRATLARHFKHELTHGRAIVHSIVGGNITQGAMRGEKALAIFFAKAQMGWRELTQQQQVGADGKPIDPAAPVTVVLVNYGSQAPTIEGTALPATIELQTEK